MKNFHFYGRYTFYIKCLLIAGVGIGLFTPAFCQADEEKAETATDSMQSQEKGAPEKMTLRASFEAFRINEEIKLVANLKMKVNGKFQQIPGVEVRFYSGEIETKNLVGIDTTDHKGVAFCMLSSAQQSDSVGPFTYWAVIQNNPDYEDVEESVMVSTSKMELILEKEDTIKMAKVFIGYPDPSGQILPLAGAECQLYVKRLFGLLPIGELETTDEEGRIAVVFPDDIHGDETGNLTVVAKIADNEIIGNVEANKTVSWGITTKVDAFYLKRELWAARANSPLSLIFIVNATLIGIWGVIVFIFLEIYRINRLGKTS